MHILLITGNASGSQDLIVEGLSKGGINPKAITPCTNRDRNLFITDLSFQLIFVEIDPHEQSESLACIDDIKAINDLAKVVAVVKSKDSDLLMELMNRGVSGILSLPLSSQEVTKILEKNGFAGGISGKVGEMKAQGDGKIVTITSYKGGTGVSTVAANLAFCMAELESIKKKTVLLDLSNQSNHCARLVGANITLTINDLCEKIEDLGVSYISSSVSWVTDNLGVIGSALTMNSAVEPPDYEALSTVLGKLSECFAYVLIDLPTHTFDSRFLACIENSSQIILVSTLDVLAITDSQNYLNLLRDLGVEQTKVRMLVNRYFSDTGMFKMQDLERAFKHPISFYIHNDYLTVNEACQSQMTVLEHNPRSLIAEDFAELAVGIDNGATFVPPKKGRAQQQKKPQQNSIFSNLLGK